MAKRSLPRIAEVTPGEKPLTLRVRWRGGDVKLIDVSEVVGSLRHYAPLGDDSSLFARVRVGEYGTDVVWTDEVDMSAETLWRLAQEQKQKALHSAA